MQSHWAVKTYTDFTHFPLRRGFRNTKWFGIVIYFAIYLKIKKMHIFQASGENNLR